MEKLNFSNELLNQISLYEKNKDENLKQNCLTELEKEYKSLLAQTKLNIQKELAQLKKNKEENIRNIEKQKEDDLNKEELKFSQISSISKHDIKNHSDAKKGLEIIAKRAKIKENNSYDLLEKETKLFELKLYQDYISNKEKLNVKENKLKVSCKTYLLEAKANFSLIRLLKNKSTWINLIPLLMLVILIACFFISNSITGYKGDLTDVINNGVFVAVVATGAVFIYSQGSFDMSLGPASLMCATIAAITYNSTQNIFLSLIVSLLIGGLLGIVNAILANVLNLPVMVMTLTMLNVLNAIHAVILQNFGNQLVVKPGMPATTIIYATFLVCFFLLCYLIFNYTKIGRRNKMIGSNPVSSKFSGVSLMKAGIISFGISGLGLGICGFLFASYNSGGSFSTGTILDTIGLNVVIAIVFGGMTTSGGPRSRVSCAIIGAFFCIFLDELFKSIGLADYRFLAKGVVFLIVSFFNMYSSRSKMLAR